MKNMLPNLILIRKYFVPVKCFGNICPQHFSPSKYFVIVRGTYRPHQEETYMRQRRRQPQAVCQVGDSFSAASYKLVISSRPWLKLCAIRKRTTIKPNWLSNFAAGCVKTKVPRIFESCRKGKKCWVQIGVCKKEKHFCLLIVWDCYADEEADEQEDEDETPLHTITSGLSGSDSVVDIATGYGLGDPGIESRWGRDFPHLSRPTLEPI